MSFDNIIEIKQYNVILVIETMENNRFRGLYLLTPC